MADIILLNKPFGFLSQFSGEPSDKTLAQLIQNQPGFYPAGRLDKKSEGLLLLTNDGRLQNQLSHPKFGKFKRYWVQVEGEISSEQLDPLIHGLAPFLPAQCQPISPPPLWPRNPPIRERKTIPTSWIDIRIQEGKNHQIRHMTAAIGFPTLRLVRYQIGDYKLGTLQPGEWRKISD
ncbi:pseudouridine synthase [Legionella sp. W05-934-2]|jgi:23S rRNA pseudouridine2457 synthase|uniref:pseudouridine synthase n=1 Tax=Legionella sp. W05-934-2 TaxID=1198649 RepID=UPI0034624C46